MEYLDFIVSKKLLDVHSGFDVDCSNLNPEMFDFQKEIVKWAIQHEIVL